MDLQGLALCSRFSYPPNSLSLCGPAKQKNLNWYSINQKPDKGNLEILSQFSTLYPYLELIARENRIAYPFDIDVVTAYWLGNNLLQKISYKPFINHLADNMKLKKRVNRKEYASVYDKIASGAFPHHSFHVLNIYKRTGHLHIPHTIETMDACIINWGKVVKISEDIIEVETRPLKIINGKLKFGMPTTRKLIPQGEKDLLVKELKIGDFVSYHWGYFCQKLNIIQLRNLIYYTNLSVNWANI